MNYFCFAPSGGIGRESTVFYKRLADFVQEERQTLYSVTTMGWLRYCLNFPLLRSAILCIRGSRFSWQHTFQESNITLACHSGGQIGTWLWLTIHFPFSFYKATWCVFLLVYLYNVTIKEEKKKSDHGHCSSDPSYWCTVLLVTSYVYEMAQCGKLYQSEDFSTHQWLYFSGV